MVRLALEKIVSGWDSDDVVKQERGWKLFFLLPHMFVESPLPRRIGPEAKIGNKVPEIFRR